MNTLGPTPLEIVEFEIELLAFNTRPTIMYRVGSRSPLRLLGDILELPPVWWDHEPSPSRQARMRGDPGRRAAREEGSCRVSV